MHLVYNTVSFIFVYVYLLYHLCMAFFYDTNHQDPGIHHDLIEERAKENLIRTTAIYSIYE